MQILSAYTQLSDEEIIDRVLSGEKSLYEVLIRRYNPYLYRTGMSYGFYHEDVEDLMQETFINAYRSLSKFQNRSSFKTWLIKIMLHECYHKAQKQKSSREITFETFVDKI